MSRRRLAGMWRVVRGQPSKATLAKVAAFLATIAATRPALDALATAITDAKPLLAGNDPTKLELVERAEQIIEAVEIVAKVASDFAGDGKA